MEPFKRNKRDFLLYTRIKRIVSWLNSSRWKPSKVSKKPRSQLAKLWTPYFGVCTEIFFINNFEKGKTINSEYYMALLDWLSKELKKKKCPQNVQKVLFHQDNVLCQKSMIKLNELYFELLCHPPYSPDLGHQTQLSVCRPQMNAPGKRGLAQIKKWLLKLKPILKAKMNHYIKKV